jgi:hypothetical protein
VLEETSFFVKTRVEEVEEKTGQQKEDEDENNRIGREIQKQSFQQKNTNRKKRKQRLIGLFPVS